MSETDGEDDQMESNMTTNPPRYREGDVVWLREHDAGDEVQPRQRGRITHVYDLREDRGWMYCGEVEPSEPGDDGLREFFEDQVEGRYKRPKLPRREGYDQMERDVA